MDRRGFLERSAFTAAGVGAGLSTLPGRPALAETSSGREPAAMSSLRAQMDPSDRSSNRDPQDVQRATLVVNGLDPSNLWPGYLDLLEAGGVNAWHRGGGDVKAFSDAYNFFDEHSDRIVAARTVRQIRQAHTDGKIAHLFGWQSADVLAEGGRPPPPTPTALRGYYEMGLRIVGLSYNVANLFGGGCLEPHVGLTKAGERLVEEIHDLDIVLDVGGHTGERTTLDAIARSSGVPVICSHANVKALNDNPRCISDRVIEAIAGTGGVIGMTAFNDFHARTRHDAHVPRTPQVGLERHLDQYDYIKELVGVDHVGLGPDFVAGPGRNVARPLDRTRMAPEAYSETPWFYVRGYEDISELPNVTEGLIQRGWSNAEIWKLLGDNWLRVYERIWGA